MAADDFDGGVDDDLSDLMEIPTTIETKSTKCYPIYLSGTLPTGCSSVIQPRACDNLICLDCDFKICRFPNLEWRSDTDYLFLRNNVPEFKNLKSRLMPTTPGVIAYCCQCKWKTVRNDTVLSRDGDLKWTCLKHTDFY